MSIGKRNSAAIVVTTMIIAMIGCNKQAESLSPVSGKVKFRGEILTRGTIVFTPDPKRSGNVAIAASTIQKDGTYELKTGNKVGAHPGWYRVTLAAYGDQSTPVPGHKFSVPDSMLPDHLRDPSTSKLTREVKGNHKNVIDFNLD